MKRWSMLLLLLLLPLTLAPRTSFTLESVDYDLAVAARDTVRVNAAAPVTFRLLSRSDRVIEDAALIIDVSVDGKDRVDIVRASRGCAIDGPTVTCAVAPIAARGEGVVWVVARSLEAGSLRYEVIEANSGEAFGSSVVAVEGTPRTLRRR